MAWIEEKKRKDGSVTYWVRYKVGSQQRAVLAGLNRDQAEQKLVEVEIELQKMTAESGQHGVA